jgi:hypothetical protein
MEIDMQICPVATSQPAATGRRVREVIHEGGRDRSPCRHFCPAIALHRVSIGPPQYYDIWRGDGRRRVQVDEIKPDIKNIEVDIDF